MWSQQEQLTGSLGGQSGGGGAPGFPACDEPTLRGSLGAAQGRGGQPRGAGAGLEGPAPFLDGQFGVVRGGRPSWSLLDPRERALQPPTYTSLPSPSLFPSLPLPLNLFLTSPDSLTGLVAAPNPLCRLKCTQNVLLTQTVKWGSGFLLPALPGDASMPACKRSSPSPPPAVYRGFRHVRREVAPRLLRSAAGEGSHVWD